MLHECVNVVVCSSTCLLFANACLLACFVDFVFFFFGFQGDNSLDAKDGDHNVNYALDNCVTDGELRVLPLQHSHHVDEVDKSHDAANKEKITLHIPLNESGSAGLGVSVKGRTETFQMGNKDLGIYVKTVLQGGAAYKVWFVINFKY